MQRGQSRIVSSLRTRVTLVIAVSLPVQGWPALAAGTASIAGDYVCASGCRLTDAPPGITIEGDIARCMNKFGGVYTGRLLTDTSVSCFRQTGILSSDGKTIVWSNGAVWKRR